MGPAPEDDGDDSLKLDPGARALLLAVAIGFTGLVAAGLHGWSLPLWHQVIDAGEMPEVWLGTPRPIRSDDWVVGLPAALAQRAHDPPFPRVNTTIGDGQDMLLMELPIAHPATLFRPASWGFFLGADTGLAWMWWVQALGLFAACFLAMRAVARGRTGLAALGAAIVTLSPFMQHWALAPARVSSYATLCIFAWCALWRARSAGGAIAWGALLGWSAGCFGLVVYPPYQVPLAWVMLATAVGWWLAERPLREADRSPAIPLSGLALAGAIAATAAVGFWLAAEPSIERMLGTVYPGRRSFLGGGVPLWRLFAHDLGVAAWVDDWGPWLNICEGAGFWLVFPVAALGLRRSARPEPVEDTEAGRAGVDPLAACLLAVIALLTLHAWVGLPNWLARATLLSQAQPERVLIGIGVADALLLVRVLSRPGPLVSDPRAALAAAVVWAGILLACIPPLQRTFPELPAAAAAGLALANAAGAWALLRGLNPHALLGAVAALLAASTLGFNPLVRGGADYLRDNPLSRQILEIDRASGGETSWLTYGSPYLSNLFRTLGVRSVNGLLALPQLEMWRRVDPEGRYERFTNRYAHFTAAASPAPGVRFRMAGEAMVEMIAAPGSEAVLRLGVTHVLIVAPDASGPDALPGIERVASHGWSHLYRVLPPSEQPKPKPAL